MSPHAEMRGGFPVAAFDSLPVAEQILVQCLRAWSNGSAGSDRIAETLRSRMAEQDAEHCQRALAEMIGIIARHGRRRMVRHKLHCSCVGSDEAVFANLVMVAATGAREDAMLLASLLIGGAALLPFVEAAGVAGLYLHRATLSSVAGPAIETQEPSMTLH